MRINNKIAMPVAEGMVSERIFRQLESDKEAGKGVMNSSLASWVTAGFALQELSNSAFYGWLGLMTSEESNAMSKRDRANMLIQLLQMVKDEDASIPVPQPVSKPAVEPAKKKSISSLVNYDT